MHPPSPTFLALIKFGAQHMRPPTPTHTTAQVLLAAVQFPPAKRGCAFKASHPNKLEPNLGLSNICPTHRYCSPQYDFPPQEEVVRFVVDAVRAEAFNPRTLFVFGTYTIGKVRLCATGKR